MVKMAVSWAVAPYSLLEITDVPEVPAASIIRKIAYECLRTLTIRQPYLVLKRYGENVTWVDVD
jgi:hypothetical protein